MKLFQAPFFPSFALTTGLITYPITFVITDTVTEIWGSRKAHLMIWIAFFMNFIMLLFIKATVALPPHESWFIPNNKFGFAALKDYQMALSSVFSVNSLVLMSSMLAYLVAQFCDVKIFTALKKKTNGKHLWLRNNVSTCVSQIIDTFIMDGIVLYLGLRLPLSTCISIGLAVYVFKVICALLDTPIVYFLTYYLKKKLDFYVQKAMV